MGLWTWVSGLRALLAGSIAAAGLTTERVPMRIAALAAVAGDVAGLSCLSCRA